MIETVSENTRSVKNSIASHLHGCFAIKSGVNSLLDLAKKTYCEIVQEITGKNFCYMIRKQRDSMSEIK